MMKHDENIQNLFDNYASELTPRQDLAEKARMEMVERKAQPSAVVRKNSSAWIHLAWIAPVAVVFVAIIVVIFSLPLFGGGGSQEENQTPSTQQPALAVTYYSYSDVKGRSVSIADYDDVLQLSRLTASGYELVGQRCYAFYTQDGQLRYVRVSLGVRAPDGTFTELELIGEVDGYVRSDLKDVYEQNKYLNGLGIESNYDESGEYVTNAYFAARDMHFYVVARNGQRTDAAQDILQALSRQD